jgi:hypothetical protein
MEAVRLLQGMKFSASQVAASLLIEKEEGLKQPIRILMIAIWSGILAGLVEGVGALALLKLGLKGGIWIEIIWISAIFNTLLFLVLLCQFQENRLSSSQKGGVPWMSIPVLTRCPSFRGS